MWAGIAGVILILLVEAASVSLGIPLFPFSPITMFVVAPLCIGAMFFLVGLFAVSSIPSWIKVFIVLCLAVLWFYFGQSTSQNFAYNPWSPNSPYSISR